MSPAGLSLDDRQASLRDGRSSLSEMLREHLAAIDQSDHQIGAFLQVMREQAEARAGALQTRVEAGCWPGPLTGLFLAVKDNISLRSVPMTAGSRILEGFAPLYDATAVARLEAAGAIVVGKTNLDEFGMGSSTEYSAFGPTRNPFALDRVPGGSSGGSAAAVAAGHCHAALGSDTGGSVRQPAAFCGLCALKPTYGAVSRHGLVAYASSMDQIGPLAATAGDCARILDVMRGADPRDMTSIPWPRSRTDALPKIRGLRAGVARSWLRLCDGDVADLLEGFLGEAMAVYHVLASAEAASNLARYDGVQFGASCAASRLLAEPCERVRAARFGPEVKRRILLGTHVLSAGYYAEHYLRAQRVRGLWRQSMQRIFEEVDVVLLPTTATAAFRVAERVGDPLAMYQSDLFTIGANLSGEPALSVPIGVTARGLPVGGQLWGPARSDDLLLHLARQYDQDQPFGPLGGQVDRLRARLAHSADGGGAGDEGKDA